MVPMVTKLGRVVTYIEGLPPKNVTLQFDHVVLQDHVTHWNNYIFTTTVSKATKLGRVVTYHEGFSTIKSQNRLAIKARTCGILLLNHWKCISTTTLPMAINLDSILTYHKGLPPTKSQNPLTMLSCEITLTYLEELLPIELLNPLVKYSCKIMWSTKTIIPSLLQYQTLGAWWLALRASYK